MNAINRTNWRRVGLAVTAAVVVLVLGAAGLASAQPGHGGWRGGPDGPRGPGGAMGLFGIQVQENLRALNLTDAQREQVRTLMETHREEGRALAERGQATLRALNEATVSGGDEGTIRQHSQALADVVGDAAILRGRIHGEVWSLLTPEQQAKATELRAARQQRMEQMRQRFEQRRQGRGAQGGGQRGR
jgi:periplasmic protein CpxP/Spy